MDTGQSARRFCWQSLLLLLQVCIVSIAVAEDSEQICQPASIKQAFAQSGERLDRAQLSDLQNQLMVSGYGKLDRDGLMGPATLEAFGRLCLDFKVGSADKLAAQLQALLAMTAQVRQKYPGWRQLIRSDAFTAWLDRQPEDRQQAIDATLQSGPAEQVIAILDDYPGSKAMAAKDALPVPSTTKNRPSAVSGPAVFYRWQAAGEDKPEGETDAATVPAEDEAALPDDVLDGLKAIEGVAYPNEFLFKRALAARIGTSKCDLWCQNRILDQARNGPIETLQPIRLSGGDCGCSQSFSGLVYGFYPFWLAGDEVQQVNFSLFDRIGFYALTLNRNGNIEDIRRWSDSGNAAAFISKAHKFRVQVDLTIYAAGWQEWSDTVINTAAQSVAQVVTETFQSSRIRSLRDVLPSLGDSSSLNADGVILYFDNYSTSKAGRKIVSFVSRVAEALDDAGSDARLNIMLGLDMNTIERRPLFDGLACILLDQGSLSDSRDCSKVNATAAHVDIDYVFTFLQEPTSASKKTLRRAIEDDFKGLERKTVLRKVVPVISPAGDAQDPRGTYAQLTDDLIYFQDNFAGVGLWPIPLVADPEMTTIEEEIITLYTDPDGTNFLGRLFDTHAPWLCQFACPNRWLFRVSFDVLAGMLLAYGLTAIWMCKLRSIYRRYFQYFLAVGLAAVLIFVVSMACDPFWQERANSVALGLFLVAIVASVWKYISKATQPPLP